MSYVGVRPTWALIASVAAVAFGVTSLISGGIALFGGADPRAAVGDAVPFVLWFNFASGFAYVLAGAGLFLWNRWGAQLSLLLAVSILVVFAAFGWHVISGGAYEMRTVGAMTLRSVFWVAIAIPACRAFECLRLA